MIATARLPALVKSVVAAGAPVLGPVLPVLARRGVPTALRGPFYKVWGFVLGKRPQRVVAHARNTFRMEGTTEDFLLRLVWLFGSWEPNLSGWVEGFLAPGDVVIDVGANVGYFSLLSAARVGPTGRVHAVEPVPAAFTALARNIALNEATNIEAHPVAASDAEHPITIYPATNLLLSSTAPTGGPGVVVRGACAADLVDPSEWPKVRLVKVDVEGEEVAALRGLTPILDRMERGSAVVVEVAPQRLARRGSGARELQDLLQQCGFSTMQILENSYDMGELAARRAEKAPVAVEALPDRIVDVIFLKGTPRGSLVREGEVRGRA